MSVVPDTTTKVKFTSDFTKLDTAGIQWVINPWDELSLTRALDLKDNRPAVSRPSVLHMSVSPDARRRSVKPWPSVQTMPSR